MDDLSRFSAILVVSGDLFNKAFFSKPIFSFLLYTLYVSKSITIIRDIFFKSGSTFQVHVLTDPCGLLIDEIWLIL